MSTLFGELKEDLDWARLSGVYLVRANLDRLGKASVKPRQDRSMKN